MDQKKTAVIGIDFGTLSGRAVLVRLSDGRLLAESVRDYDHAVCDTAESVASLTGVSRPVDPGTALQHPADYLDVLRDTIPALLRQSGLTAEEIGGIGLDFTACSPLPLKADGTPLCFLPEFQNDPHAYVKLWKHHGAMAEADEINAKVPKELLARFAGGVSCEWLLPKLYETCRKSPRVYAAADQFAEAGDWIVQQLCGNWVTSSCMAGFKAMWDGGYPSDFIASLPGMQDAESKLLSDVRAPGECAGTLTAAGAALTGLCEGIPVSTTLIDAHSCVIGAGVDRPGKLLGILGTSGCYLLLGDDMRRVEGCCGVVKDGVIPGYYSYEAGQSCLGDHFQWYVDNALPASYAEEAAGRGVSPHVLLCEKADQLPCGSGGLLALDWWNGNRSVLCDYSLSGMMVGLTLETRPEQIYRALIEATAYGARKIIEAFTASGIAVDALYATGGIPQKNPLFSQIYADVLGIPVVLSGGSQCGAQGAAMLAATAGGFFPTLSDAVRALSGGEGKTYRPNADAHAAYDALYAEYTALHDYFGRGGNDVMKRLRKL